MKIMTREQLQELAERYKAEGKVTVFTNGCFDILHAGHVRYLGAAKKLGDCLIVGLNSDTSVQQLKGPTRPVNCQEDRAEVIAALAAVDYIVVFNETTAEALVAAIQPDIYAKGGDYRIDDLPEAKIVAQYGGRTVLVPEVPGKSSTNIIRKLVSNRE